MSSTSEIPSPRDKATGNSRRLILLAAGGVLIGLLVGWLTIQFATGNWRLGPYVYRGVALPTPESVADFTLTAHDGKQVRLSDFRGEIVALYFGYTYCPDVCPTTMAALSSAIGDLKPGDKEHIQVLMVSVDPERDSPQVLADYLAHFDPAFLGLTGTEQEIARAAEAFGIFYAKGPGSAASGYLVDHTSTVSVVDKDGRLRLLFPFGTPAEDMAADLQHLVDESR